MKITAIVLSAGTGRRMGSDIPKQYMELNGYPVLYYSLKTFQESIVDEIILVCGSGDVEFCRHNIVEKYGINKVSNIVEGGKERYNSVYNGILAATEPDYILIHDGARPMIDNKIVEDSIEAVKIYKACVVGMPVKDTIKVIDGDGYAQNTPERKYLWQVQTPQSFEFELIRESYRKVIEENVQGITDDAMVVEYAADQPIKLIEGSYENLKITTPEDLKIAQILLQNKKMKKN